jgi:hypothetical protein
MLIALENSEDCLMFLEEKAIFENQNGRQTVIFWNVQEYLTQTEHTNLHQSYCKPSKRAEIH